MKRRFATGITSTAVCLFCAGALVFAQTSAKSPKALQKHNQPIPPAKRGSSASSNAYVVKKGDTLFAIAKNHGISAATLKSINHLRTNLLQIGQRLRLSATQTASMMAIGNLNTPQAASGSETSGRPAAAADPSATEDALAADPDAVERWEAPNSGGGAGTQLDSTEEPLRLRLASAGIEFLGARYRWNGDSERSGFDCSGFVKCLFEKFKISLPRSSREQFKVGAKIDKTKLEVGDLVFFSSRGKIPSHVGIYIGDNKFLHAARKAKKVLISNLTAAWYSKRFLGARRLSDLWEPESKPAETRSN